MKTKKKIITCACVRVYVYVVGVLTTISADTHEWFRFWVLLQGHAPGARSESKATQCKLTGITMKSGNFSHWKNIHKKELQFRKPNQIVKSEICETFCISKRRGWQFARSSSSIARYDNTF